MHDVVIKNARIIDGTGASALGADVAINGKKITEVGILKHADAKTLLDVNGKVLAPGFIDMHSHADFSLPVLPTADSLLHQGITTLVTGQCGLSPAPLLKENRKEVIASLSGFLGEFAKEVPWSEWASFEDYLNFLRRRGISPNVVPLVGQGVIRSAVMGFCEGNADQIQISTMRQEVMKALEQGAIGLSTGLIYPPGSFTSTQELIELTGVVAVRNGFYFSHIRGEGDTLLEAVEEAIRIGRETGAAVQISHFKAARKDNWHKSQKALDLIGRARADGLDVTVDLYPYLAGSTALATLLPDWAHVGGPAETLKRLTEPNLRVKMKDDMTAGGFARGIEWKDVLITSSSNHTAYEGRYVSELASEAGKSAHDWLFDALLETRLNMSMAVFGMSEENRQAEIQFPSMMIGTDGFGLATAGPLSKGVPHPRNYGAFPRVLGRYVRELQVLTLEEAVCKMTGLPAQKLRLADRGVIRPGSVADIVVFDPAAVTDRATYDNPHQYAGGISEVLVNGRLVIHDGAHTGATPGEVIHAGQ